MELRLGKMVIRTCVEWAVMAEVEKVKSTWMIKGKTSKRSSNRGEGSWNNSLEDVHSQEIGEALSSREIRRWCSLNIR